MDMEAIKQYLGEPYYQTDNCLIYNADCFDIFKKLPKNSINLTFTSPPYNIGKEYEEIIPVSEYVSWCSKWISQIYYATKPDGAFWLNVGYLEVPGKAKALPIPYLLWDKTDFYLLQEVVWNYGAGVASKRSLSPRNEKILWYVKDESSYVFNLDPIRDKNVKYPNQKKNGKLRCNPLGKNPSDVWQIPKVTSGKNRSSKERTKHPAQTPIAVVERIIKGCSNDGDLVLDPFLGSGTTAVAALVNNRKVIGIEISKEYCDMAIRRIESEVIIKSQSLLALETQPPYSNEPVVQKQLFDQPSQSGLAIQI